MRYKYIYHTLDTVYKEWVKYKRVLEPDKYDNHNFYLLTRVIDII